jgi:hypothetical protein
VASHKKTILPITGSIKSVCELLDGVVGDFIATCRERLPPLRYEAEIEALNLIKMAMRNVEGVMALARRDLILLPPLSSLRARALKLPSRRRGL